MIILGLLGRVKNKPSYRKIERAKSLSTYKLKPWLCGLGLFFVACFIMLRLIASLYEGQDALRSKDKKFEAGIRTGFLLLFSCIRTWIILRKQHQANLLDCLNLCTIIYSLAIYLLTGFRETSYLALPVQLIITLDILYTLIGLIYPYLSSKMNNKVIGIASGSACGPLIGIEHFKEENFLAKASDVSHRQMIWEKPTVQPEDN